MKGAKIALIVICFLGAGIIAYFTWGSDEGIPESGGSKTTWKCADCGKIFELTDAESYRQFEQYNDGKLCVKCPACSKRDAWQVALCPTCNQWYWGVGKPGSDGMCPRCKPKPADNGGYVDQSAPEKRHQVINAY